MASTALDNGVYNEKIIYYQTFKISYCFFFYLKFLNMSMESV